MSDLDPGEPFPDISLPDHTGDELSLSDIALGKAMLAKAAVLGIGQRLRFA